MVRKCSQLCPSWKPCLLWIIMCLIFLARYTVRWWVFINCLVSIMNADLYVYSLYRFLQLTFMECRLHASHCANIRNREACKISGAAHEERQAHWNFRQIPEITLRLPYSVIVIILYILNMHMKRPLKHDVSLWHSAIPSKLYLLHFQLLTHLRQP